MDIISRLKEILDKNLYSRRNKEEVVDAFKRLDVNASDVVKEFYFNFAGPFWEQTLGMELLDIVNDGVNIESITNECREVHMFPKKYLVLTEMEANEVIVLNTLNDKVYRVDFEGGDEELLNEELGEDWESFEDFLVTYFGL